MKILVILPNWLGDLVHASPLLQLLKQQGHELHAIAHGGVAELAKIMPEISSVIEPPFSRHGLNLKKLKERFHFAKEVITPEQFEQAVILPNSAKSALIPWFAGIKVRIGYRGEMRYGLINRMHFDPVLGTAASDRKLRRNITSFYAALAFTPARKAPQRNRLPWPHLQIPLSESMPSTKYVVFAMGAEFGPAKRWGYQNYANLAVALVSKGFIEEAVLLGNNEDIKISVQFIAYVKNSGLNFKITNLCGQTSLTQAAQWMAQSFLFVGNDSGLSHIAAALNKPVLGVYGPTDPKHTPTLGKYAHTISLNLQCSPCQKRVCPLGHNHCMTELTASMAMDSIQKILAFA